MNISLKKPFNLSCQRVYAFSILALFGLHLLGELLPMRVADLLDTYGLVCICLLFGVYLARFAGKSPIENKIYLIWIGWMLITRWLNGDIYLFVDFDLIITCILGFLFMSVGTVLDKKDREIFIDFFSFVYSIFLSIAALLGILVFITNTYIHIPPENIWFTIVYDGTLFAPNFLSTPRTIFAFRLLTAWCLLVYQFVKRKNNAVRILILFFLIVLYIAISLCHGRASLIGLMVSFALIALLLGQAFFKHSTRIISLFGSGVFMLIFVFSCYLGNNLVCKLISDAHSNIAPAFEDYYNNLENKMDEELFGIGESADELMKRYYVQKDLKDNVLGVTTNLKPISENNIKATATPLMHNSTNEKTQTLTVIRSITSTDPRSLFGNRTLSGRIPIWHSGFVSIFKDPEIALRGLLSKQVAQTFNKVMAELYPTLSPMGGMHNSFLQTLMVSGIPGLLIVTLWTVLLVFKMVKFFFSRKTCPWNKFLTLPIASLLVVSLVESLLFVNFELSGIVFYLTVGCFWGNYYDCFEKKRSNIL